MSLALLARAIAHTAAISWPTVWESARDQLTAQNCDERLERWSRQLLEDAEVELDVRGLEHLERTQSYVTMSNHESLYDIPVLFQALPLKLRMAAKAELFRIPLWGRAMRDAGFVRIDRRHGAAAREALLEAGSRLRAERRSLWIAPEGTRGPGDGQLLPFKTGAFALAQALELPVLPVALVGTAEILGKHGHRVKRGCHVTVRVLRPIRLGDEAPPEAAARLRTQLAAELGQLRARPV